MRIPITKYGLPQVAVFPAIIIIVMAVALLLALKFKFGPVPIILIELALFAVLIWVLAFFRDPARTPPQDTNILLSPADGLISDITVVDEPAVGGEALRIGIFLNIFNVHINRTPCAVTINDIKYKKGKYKNALNPESAQVNEANALTMTRLNEPKDKLLVRQISGAIARRIVCRAKPGDKFKSGEKFGMIKFGSRTELYLPNSDSAKCQVKIGDKVKAGLTILVRYKE